MTNTIYHKALAIGLTGGIGSGKTEAGKLLAQMGASFLQADLIAREFMNSDGQIKRQIRTVIGEDIYRSDGMLDRIRVGTMIYNDQSLQIKINQIVHPPVIAHIRKEIDKVIRKKLVPFIVVEAALIFEAGVESMFDYTVVVDADTECRIARLMKRDKKNRDDIQKQFHAQLDQVMKTEMADFVIRNDGSLESLQEQCKFLFHLFTTMAKNPPVKQPGGSE